MTIHMTSGVFGQDETMTVDLKRAGAQSENNVILTLTSRTQILNTQTVRFGVGEDSKQVKVQISQLGFNGGVVSVNIYDVKKSENKEAE